MYRIIYYQLTSGQEVVVRKSGWRNTLAQCYEMRQPMQYFFKRIESRVGSLFYFYSLLDEEGRCTFRSLNYQDPNQALEMAMEESTRQGLHYNLDSIFVHSVAYSI